MDVTSGPSVPVCPAILKWEQAMQWQVQAMQWQVQAMQWQVVWSWSHLRRMAPVLPCQAARESCVCASAHPA
jgi:hypothetical protein